MLSFFWGEVRGFEFVLFLDWIFGAFSGFRV